MEKYSQFRDKGTAISPFLPIPQPPTSPLWLPLHVLLFAIRLPPVLLAYLVHSLILTTLPASLVPPLLKKAVLWLIIGIPGIWWVDLQVDGVKRGTLASQSSQSTRSRRSSGAGGGGSGSGSGSGSEGVLPGAGSVIAASFTSPVDVLYLGAIFECVFVRAWPGEDKVAVVGLWDAVYMALSPPQVGPPASTTGKKGPAPLLTLQDVAKSHPNSRICVFPECTTTNGRGILPLSPCLLTAAPGTKIHPVNLRYSPADITTPVPGNVGGWLWRLLSRPTHTMRVRVARPVYNTSTRVDSAGGKTSAVDGLVGWDDEDVFGDEVELRGEDGKGTTGHALTAEEKEVLDRVGEDLARLGRVKRVGLEVGDKVEFVKLWGKRRR